MNKYLKTGVSDFTLKFDDGSEIFLNTVASETIKYYASGEIEITIEEVQIITDLMENIKIGNKLSKVVQEFYTYNIVPDGKAKRVVWEYDNLKIAELHTISKDSNFTSFNITIKSNIKNFRTRF